MKYFDCIFNIAMPILVLNEDHLNPAKLVKKEDSFPQNTKDEKQLDLLLKTHTKASCWFPYTSLIHHMAW